MVEACPSLTLPARWNGVSDFQDLNRTRMDNAVRKLDNMEMVAITREQLHAYLDDALTDAETAHIEQALRSSEEVRLRLRQAREERDRGEHTVGAIWRRYRVSCLTREELNGYLHEIHDAEFRAFIDFHLGTICCPTCLANLDDLKEKQAESASRQRRRKIFDSSAGLLESVRRTE